MQRKLRMGMVGGGPGAFIGDVHRKAARLDGQIDIVAGAFDVDPKKSKQQGKELMIDLNRAYPDYKTMIAEELKLPLGERIDFVTIVTPNFLHFPVARDFLNAGFKIKLRRPIELAFHFSGIYGVASVMTGAVCHIRNQAASGIAAGPQMIEALTNQRDYVDVCPFVTATYIVGFP